MYLIYTKNKGIRRDVKSDKTIHDGDRIRRNRALQDILKDPEISTTMTAEDLRSLPIFIKSRQLAAREVLIRQRIRRMTAALDEQIRDLSRTEPPLSGKGERNSGFGHRDTAA